MILLPSTRQRIARLPLLFRAHDCLDEQGLFALSYGKKVAAVSSRTGPATGTDQRGRYWRAAGGQTRVGYSRTASGLLVPSVLLEHDAVNYLRHSRDFTNEAFWGRTNITVTPGAIRAPDGTMSGARIAVTATGAAVMTQLVSDISTTVATYTIFARKGSGASDANRFLLWNDTTAAEVAGCVINYDDGSLTVIAGACRTEALTGESVGWYRITMTATAGITAGDDLRAYVTQGGSSQAGGTFAYVWQADLTPLPFATSPIPTTSVTVARNRDDLYLPSAVAPQRLTVYARGVNLGIAAVNSAWFYSFENGSGGNPRLIGLMDGAGRTAAYYEHGSFVSSVPLTGTLAYGDLFEHRTELHGDGSVVGSMAVNDGPEVIGARSAAAASGLAAAWSGQRVYLASPAGGRGPMAYTHFAVAPAHVSRDELRDLCEVG